VATDSTLRILEKEQAAAPISSRAATRFLASLWALTKPEINFLIAITVLISFLLARQGSHPASIFPVFNTILGTALVSSGAAALNQFIERRFDRRMRRTARRPLVMESVTPLTALLFGVTISVLGLFYLDLWANPLSSLIAGLTSLIYLTVYTPLKRITPLCTAIGAIPGAASPLIGWAAATGTLDRRAFVLYVLLYLWQFPHFMAIAWMYRDDYERAGYRMLPGYKSRRMFAALQAAIPAALLIPVSLLPWIAREAGSVYFAVAILLGLGFGWLTLRFSLRATNVTARQLLFASIVYLPTALTFLLMDKR
jgi:protoheme IX farnesyltransferase